MLTQGRRRDTEQVLASVQRAVFRHRDKIAIAFLLAVLVNLAHTGKTLGLREPVEDWFDLLGCLIIALGHLLRVLALRNIGPRSRSHRLGAQRLVTDGVYAVVRNPLYLGNCVIALGLCMIAQLEWLLWAGPPIAFLLYYLAGLAEERRLLEQFGEAYRRYCMTVPRFFPRILLGKRGWRMLVSARAAHGVLLTKEYQAFLSSAACILLFELIEHLRRVSGFG